MKEIKIALIVFSTVIVGYILYLGIEMSSTYPPIKEYKLEVSKAIFSQKLADRIHDSQGWSFQEREIALRE